MHGIVFDQLREFTVASYGHDTWTKMLGSVPERASYYVSESYPDAEFETLLGIAVGSTGRSRNDLLLDLGQFIVPGLLHTYGVLIDPKWDLMEVLEHVEGTIHRVVRLRQPGARPPHLSTHKDGPDQVSILYTSPRRMCWLGKGIIHGLQAHYGERVNVSDETCMHLGDESCTIVVRRRPGTL